MSRLNTLLVALVAFATYVHAAQHFFHKGLCDYEHCECKEAIHPAWITINCTTNGTAVNIGHMDLPPSTMELEIQGSDSVVFSAGAFNSVKDLRRISIIRSKTVMFRPLSAMDLNVLNLSLEVQHCKLLRFEKKSFNNNKGPLSVTVDGCETVSVAGETFSWLLNFKVSNVLELSLGSGSFTLDATATTMGKHGLGLTIELINSTIPEFTKGTFASSAGKLYFEGLNIEIIRGGAFSANTYSLVQALRCNIHTIEEDAFSGNSLIEYLILDDCKIKHLSSKALNSAIEKLSVNKTRFNTVDSGAINTTVASVTILSSEFHKFARNGFEFSSWNLLQMENNSFDELPANAISAPGAQRHKLIFKHNEIETVHPESLSFIGKAAANGQIEYENNYYGIQCSCNVTRWLGKALDISDEYQYEDESYCTVEEFLARCFNVPEQNILYQRYLKQVCHKDPTLHCEAFISNGKGAGVEFKNTRFPHKVLLDDDDELSYRNKKVIGIIIVTCLGCILIACIFSAVRWWRKRRGDGNCMLKTVVMSSNTACGSLCSRLCSCGSNVGIANARSISQLSVNEYSERHRLNESRAQDVQESSFREDIIIPTEEKFTQTLPEELTKELLEKLKERLDNPENYVEAREMIEHLYELTKMEAGPNFVPANSPLEENIYELPYQEQARIGRNKKKMISVGTRTPSLDKLLPLSPYYRQTALSHEYFEPKDLAVHLYAEIANNDKEKRTMLGSIPDVIAEQAIPRGPYLQAKLLNSSSPIKMNPISVDIADNPRMTSTMKSNSSNSSGKMINRPLPEKPSFDPGEGTSYKHG